MRKNNENEPAYAAIYSDLRQKIFGGILAPGDLMPSESQLCAEYAVSHETVRKGIKQLVNEGLVISKPKVGYFVSKPNHSDFTITFTDQMDDCTSHYIDIHGVIPDERIREALDIPNGKIVIEFSQVRCEPSGKPVAYDIKYVPYERAYPSVESEIRFAVFPDITFSKMTSFSFYTNIEIQPTGATPGVANVLQCEVGEPLLLIQRTFIQHDGKRIGYALHYARHPYNILRGMSGHLL